MSAMALRGLGWSSIAVCSKRGLLAGPGRGRWLVDQVAGALGAWRVVAGDSTGTTGVDDARERIWVRRATLRIRRKDKVMVRDHVQLVAV
jgi:hypothetical protein